MAFAKLPNGLFLAWHRRLLEHFWAYFGLSWMKVDGGSLLSWEQWKEKLFCDHVWRLVRPNWWCRKKHRWRERTKGCFITHRPSCQAPPLPVSGWCFGAPPPHPASENKFTPFQDSRQCTLLFLVHFPQPIKICKTLRGFVVSAEQARVRIHLGGDSTLSSIFSFIGTWKLFCMISKMHACKCTIFACETWRPARTGVYGQHFWQRPLLTGYMQPAGLTAITECRIQMCKQGGNCKSIQWVFTQVIFYCPCSPSHTNRWAEVRIPIHLCHNIVPNIINTAEHITKCSPNQMKDR